MVTTNEDAALSYQAGNFCLMIWDSYNTNSVDALESLAEILKVKEEKAGPVLLEVNALAMESWEDQDYANAILKEAAKLYGYEAASPITATRCIQSCINYLANVCHMSKKEMNDTLSDICKSFITHSYKEIEVED